MAVINGYKTPNLEVAKAWYDSIYKTKGKEAAEDYWKKAVQTFNSNSPKDEMRFAGKEAYYEWSKQQNTRIKDVISQSTINYDKLELNKNEPKGENPTTSSPTETPTTSSPTETPTTSSPTTSTPTVTDKTNENIESPINGAGYYDQWIAYQKEQQEANWKREDEIRKEVQEREDNAWQRAVEDMRKAGVNPNLVDAGPASSGGGIYNATQVDNSTLNTAMTSEVSKYAADIEAETANLDREMQMKIAQVQASLEKYLAEYNGDIQLTLQAFEHEQEKLIVEIEHNYSKELAEIEQKYSKEIQYLEQKFTGKENKKNRVVTILSSLAGVFSISKLFKK